MCLSFLVLSTIGSSGEPAVCFSWSMCISLGRNNFSVSSLRFSGGCELHHWSLSWYLHPAPVFLCVCLHPSIVLCISFLIPLNNPPISISMSLPPNSPSLSISFPPAHAAYQVQGQLQLLGFAGHRVSVANPLSWLKHKSSQTQHVDEGVWLFPREILDIRWGAELGSGAVLC